MIDGKEIAHLTPEESANLKKRYLLWLYKTTREAIEKIDRKFTQLYIDRSILKQILDVKVDTDKAKWERLIKELQEYIENKEKFAISLKYIDSGKSLNPEYLFLRTKLDIIEKIIVEEFGQKELKKMQLLYEEEMQRRILEEREHK